jgi:hypothetical protein
MCLVCWEELGRCGHPGPQKKSDCPLGLFLK